MDEIVEVVETLDKDVKAQILLTGVAIGAGLGLAVGAVGWLVAKKRLELKYEQLANEEIAEAKAFYARLYKQTADPEQTVASLHPDKKMDLAVSALKTYQGEADEQNEEEDVETTTEVNVFEEHQTDYIFDLEEEIKRRSVDKPYVISEEEWSENQNSWQQVTLTYYAGDATLADEKEEHIPDVEMVIGSANLDRFGHGCGDANTVFIRNEKMGVQFEVVRSEGKYAHEVLGLQHSDETYARRPRRTRMDDD